MKYIDAEKLKAEIERLKAKYRKDMYMSSREGLASGYKIEAYNELLLSLDSLQQEQHEVELEQEIIRYQREDMDRDTTMRDVARHFYELGCNARKEGKK